MVRDPYTLFVVFLGVVLVCVFLDRKYAFARKLSPVLLILFLAALLSNTGIITDSAPFYERLIDFTVPFAVCLVLFTVNLRDLKRVGLPLLLAFAIACAGTFLGAIAAGYALDPYLQKILGPESWKLSGPFTGTYIGGSLNFFALWTGLDIGNPDLFAAANAVDNLTLFPLFAIWIFVPEWLSRFFPVARVWRAAGPPSGEEIKEAPPARFRILDVVALSFIAMGVILFSGFIRDRWLEELLPGFPAILIVTSLALIMAQFRFMGRLEGAIELGNIAFYLFFCAVGAMIDLHKAITLSPILFLYVMVIIAIHMAVVYGIGRMCRLDIRILTMASAATKSGPPTVLALANVKGWKTLALPGVAVGLLGYAVGNYFGMAAAWLMKILVRG